MGRRAARVWHATLSLAAGVLYFFFVLPRWPELTGETSHALGTAARIAAGVLIALAALPVVFTLLRTRKPEFGTPALALTLLTASVVAHVLAGVLIVATAIGEIWLNLDIVGQWLFGIYGAAAAIAVLGVVAFYLSAIAELPPPAPKPIKPKKDKKKRRATADDEVAADAVDSETPADADDTEAAQDPVDDEESAEPEAEPVSTAADEPTVAAATDEPGGLRNRRPTGKGSHRRRPRRGVAVED